MQAFNFLFLLCIAGILASCAQLSHKPIKTYSLAMKESERLRFSGKGAGAGMMLSSSMGPMGIAIGVAIDEGIAKDIQKSLTEKVGALDEFVQVEVSQFLTEDSKVIWKKFEPVTGASYQIVVHKVGFKILQQESTSPVWELEISRVQGEETTKSNFRFPEDCPEIEIVGELESIKTDGKMAAELLTGSLRALLDRALE